MDPVMGDVKHAADRPFNTIVRAAGPEGRNFHG